MSERKSATSAGNRRRGRPGLGALALLAMTWMGAAGDVRADAIVLKGGEMIEGSIVDATRNTVTVRGSVGGVRQMWIRDIDEIRIDLAPGRQVVGQFVSWADGVYELSSGGDLIWISEGNIVSRQAREVAIAQRPESPPKRAAEPRVVKMAAAPAAPARQEMAAARATPASEPMVAQKPEGQDRRLEMATKQGLVASEEPRLAVAAKQSPDAGAEQSRATVGGDQRPAAREGETRAVPAKQPGAGEGQSMVAVGKAQSPAVGSEHRLAVASTERPGAAAEPGRAVAAPQSPAVGEPQRRRDEVKTRGTGEQPGEAVGANQRPATGADQPFAAGGQGSLAAGKGKTSAAGEQRKLAALEQAPAPATGQKSSLAVKATADPVRPGADQMVFRIELSRPAERMVVLIYGTLEGTAKAGEDFEPQQGLVTLAPGAESAEVHVPLIESPAKGERSFELFLTADPKVAEVVDQRIVATIDGGN